MKPLRLFVLGLALLLAVAFVAWPDEPKAVRGHLGKLPELTMADLRPHLEAFQRITMEHGGNRGHGTDAYIKTMEYVEGLLRQAGYETRRQEYPWQREYGANLIAEWPGGDPANILMIGAHLDSVAAGPGINDNGSGSAAILALALSIARLNFKPRKHLRFAWWGTEELGLIGSKHYVRMLKPEEIKTINGYVNVDMIASPNGGHFIYDSDDSQHSGQGPGAAGSAEIEAALTGYFDTIGIRTYPVDFDGRSDYYPFLLAGIPTGGLLTGTREIKTEEMAQWWGGKAGEPFDPCYHKACDTTSNLNETIYLRNTNAVVHAVGVLA